MNRDAGISQVCWHLLLAVFPCFTYFSYCYTSCSYHREKHKTPLFLTCWFGCGFWCWTCCGVRGAVIKFIDLLDVYFTKALPLTNGSPLVLWNDRRKSIPSEGIFSIVHYGSIIVRKVQGICVSMTVFLKVKLLIWQCLKKNRGQIVKLTDLIHT